MIYRDGEYIFSNEELEDILQCLKEYKVYIELMMNQKKPIGKTVKKAFKERLDYFDMLFLNLQEIKNNVEFKKEISIYEN